MTTPFENFVNIALGKSVSSDVTLPTADEIPVFTGIGRQVTGKTKAELGLATSSQLTGKADLVDGLVPATQLPGYVDDVLEYADLASFPLLGEASKLYIAIDTNLVYRWGGSTYAVTSSSLALGETSTTAYYGNNGKTAYDHSQAKGNPHNLPAASTSADGYLTSTDWNTFNGKQAALADVVTANTYGSSTQYPIVTVNAKGIVTSITLQTVAPASAPAYAAGVAYVVGELVHHQNHIWRVLVAHTGAIPFVNGNLELVGDVFQLFLQSTPYVAQRLGVKSPSLNMVDKTLDVTFYVNAASTIDISEAPARVTVRNGNTHSAEALTITKTHATNSVVFVDDTGTNINTTSGLTATYVITLGAGQEVELLNLSYSVVVKLRNQNTVGMFKLCDNSSTLDADKNDGWLFAGSATAPRTITLPDADVDLGSIPAVGAFNSNTISNGGTILSRNSKNSAVNGVVLVSGNSLKTGFNYSTPGVAVVRTGKSPHSYLRPAVVETILADYMSSSTSNALSVIGTGVGAPVTADKPYAASPKGSDFWTLGGGLDILAVHTLTFACSVTTWAGLNRIFSGQRRVMVRRVNATDTYTIEDVQTIGVDVGTAGVTGISVTITLDDDRLNIVIGHTTPSSSGIITTATLTSLITSLG